MNFSPAAIALITYGLLALIGGAIGFVKSQSQVSLISGSLSGLGLIASGIILANGQTWGKASGMAIALLLTVTFIVRIIKTQKAMPAGLMIIGGVATLVIATFLS